MYDIKEKSDAQYYNEHLIKIRVYTYTLLERSKDLKKHQAQISAILPKELGFSQSLENMHSAIVHLMKINEKNMRQSFLGEKGKKYWGYLCSEMDTTLSTITGYNEIIQVDIAKITLNAPSNILSNFCKDIQTTVYNIISIVNVIHDLNTDEYQDLYLLEDHSIYFTNQSQKIMIIDNDPFKSDLFSRCFDRIGHISRICTGGKEALNLLEKETVDLILLDLLMPKMDGYDTLVELKKNTKTKDIPVLVVSSTSNISEVIRCIEIGADDYLPIPFNTTLLYARVNSCLEKKSLRKQNLYNKKNLQTAISNTDRAVAIFDKNDLLICTNDTFKTFYPFEKKKWAIAPSYEEILRFCVQENIYAPFSPTIGSRKTLKDDQESWIRHRLNYHANREKKEERWHEWLTDGTHLEVSEKNMPEGGTIVFIRDMEKFDKKSSPEARQFLASLPSRHTFDQKLSQTTHPVSLLFVDVEDVVDTHHIVRSCRDDTLVYVAQKILNMKNKNVFLAYLGGETFALIIAHMASKKDCDHYAKDLCAMFKEGALKKDPHVNISVGCALVPQDGDIYHVLYHINQALYLARQSCKSTHVFISDIQVT